MRHRIVTISAAVVLALLGTVLVLTYVGRADARALEDVESIEVLVAAGPLSRGQTVAEAKAGGLIASAQLPRKVVPEQSLTALTSSDDPLVFASDVTQGEILQRPRLVQATEVDRGLVIPEGKLAVSVALEDPARVGQFVTAGSQVVVFDSFNAFEGNDAGKSRTPSGDHLDDEFLKNKATRVLLPRVTVLAVGASTGAAPAAAEASDDGLAAAPASTTTLLTLAVDQDEAEKLVHGIQTGTLYLGLLDTYEVQPGPGVDNRTLFDD